MNFPFLINPKYLKESAWTGHIPFAAFLVKLLKPKTIVELGTHRGNSYFSFCQAVQELGIDTKCYAVDTWQGDSQAGFYADSVFNMVNSHNEENYKEFSSLLRMKFDEANPKFSSESVDLLHIDGFHSYEAVKHDFESWLPKLSKNAVVLFHDVNIFREGFGVWQYWAELKERYTGFQFLHSAGLGVLLVGSEVPTAVTEIVPKTAEDELKIQQFFATLGSILESKAGLKQRLENRENKVNDLRKERVVLRSQVDHLRKPWHKKFVRKMKAVFVPKKA